MSSVDINFSNKNMEQPFTELFSLIKIYDVLPDGFRISGYHVDEVKVLSRHTNNAITLALQGLQDVGNLIHAILNQS